MYGTSCDRHTGSLDEPRNRWPSGLQQIQVLPRSFGHGTGGWGVSGTWSPVVFILGPCHDWSDLATDTTGLGKKWVFCSMSWKMYEDVWINEDVSNWRWKIYRELIRSWWIVPLFPVHVLRSFLNSPQLLKKRHSNNPGFSVDLSYPPATSASTDPRFHKELGFLKPYRSGSWVTSEGTFVWSSYERWGIRGDVKFWLARDGVLTFT